MRIVITYPNYIIWCVDVMAVINFVLKRKNTHVTGITKRIIVAHTVVRSDCPNDKFRKID